MHSYIASYIVFKYVIFILLKDKNIFRRIDLYFWGFGEKLNDFQGFWECRQMLLGRRGNYLQGFGEINALFSGVKVAQTPPPPNHIRLFSCLEQTQTTKFVLILNSK